jgi:hypothetical protein
MFTASLVTNSFGILILIFIFWKRLKEDYASEIIFKAAFIVLLGILVGWAVSSKFFPVWYLWSDFLGLVLGLVAAIYVLKIRFYESFEALIIASLPWVGLVFLKDSVFNSSLNSFLAFLVILLVVFVAYWLDVNYKNFTWYKSGKIGFAGVSALGLIFLIRSLVATIGIPMLSFVGKFEAIISGAAAFICFLLLYNLGRISE